MHRCRNYLRNTTATTYKFWRRIRPMQRHLVQSVLLLNSRLPFSDRPLSCLLFWSANFSSFSCRILTPRLLSACLGYSLKLLPQSRHPDASPYGGEWISKVVAFTGDWLCVSLGISVPSKFHVSVDLVTNTSTKTVYTVENEAGETVSTDMLTVFEVQVDAALIEFGQLVVYVSEGTAINNVDIVNQQCNSTGMSLVEDETVKYFVPIPTQSPAFYSHPFPITTNTVPIPTILSPSASASPPVCLYSDIIFVLLPILNHVFWFCILFFFT